MSFNTNTVNPMNISSPLCFRRLKDSMDFNNLLLFERSCVLGSYHVQFSNVGKDCVRQKILSQFDMNKRKLIKRNRRLLDSFEIVHFIINTYHFNLDIEKAILFDGIKIYLKKNYIISDE